MNKIVEELKHHIPFTAFGAMTGILLLLFFRNLPHEKMHSLFYVFHPLHVVLSAIATTTMYKIHKCKGDSRKCSLWMVLFVGYFGSIGIATISDSLIPYLGETLLGLPARKPHIGFIEEWWLVNSAAFIGIAIGSFNPGTKIPHAGHVLISTWASLFHVLMALGGAVSGSLYAVIFLFLFLSVWLPCCISDIVFPLLFVKNGKKTGSG